MRFASRFFLVALALPCAPVAHAQPAPSPRPVEVEEEEEEEEEIIVQGTRNRRRVQDEAIRVEVVTREEIEEKALMRPGQIAMLVNESPGVRIQLTSPALGAALIRIQGMEGRYTQLLADGLPLYGGQASSLGVLQIAPTDLGQVEIIKGAASALYGPSALGGVINLVSRRPKAFAETELLANLTARNGQDLTGFTAAPLDGGISGSLTGGAHRQTRQDLDGDGWIDMPGYERVTVRPRLFWTGADGASAFLTLGAMREERRGGTIPGRSAPDGQPFVQAQDSKRYDVGVSAEFPLPSFGTLHLRGSAMRQDDRHVFGTVTEDDDHSTAFAEASLSGGGEPTSWVAGVAFQQDRFHSATFPAFNFTYRVPGVFAQVEKRVGADLKLAGSARLDHHNRYGTQFSPRLSALYRPGPWTVRASLGRGFFAPTPFVEEIEAAGLSRLEPLGKLRAETATTGSLDVGYTRGSIEARATLFASNIGHAARLRDVAPNRVRLVNLDGSTRIRGSELLLRYKWNALTLTGSYVFVDANEPDETTTGRRRVPLTPRHTGGLVAMWEKHGRGRLGFEAYYTGWQALEDNPYRARSKPYVHLGLLGEIVLGKLSLFANAENLLNVRQTRTDPLLRPTRAPSGEWTVDAWAPLEGFILNGGLRLRLNAGR